MKKLYQDSKYVLWQKSRNKKIELNKRKRRLLNYQRNLFITKNHKAYADENEDEEIAVAAPQDFRLIENTEQCLTFFRKIRNAEHLNRFEKVDQGVILNLKVLTNNALLHFDDPAKSKTLDKGSARFKGTFYQWVMNKNSIENLIF